MSNLMYDLALGGFLSLLYWTIGVLYSLYNQPDL